MTEATWYSVGVDLSQTPWQIATVDADGTESVVDRQAGTPTSGESSSEQGDAEGITVAVRKVAATRAAMPASIALHAGAGHETDNLAGEVARRLGMDTSAVQLLGTDAAGVKPSSLVLPSVLALVAARSAAAIGHASTLGPAAVAGPTGVSLSAGGVGAAGVSLGSGSAGPAGVSLGAGGAAGPAGVPLGASSVSGPIGVPIGTGQGVGPTGQSLTGSGGSGSGVGLAGRLRRFPVVVGVAVALIVVSVIVVVASGDDAPIATPSPVATEPGVVIATTAAPTALVSTTLTPTTVSTATTVSGAACAVGSWLADNDAYLAAMQAAAFDATITWESVAGALRLDIANDGAVATTYEAWTFTSSLGGAGTATSVVQGVDKNMVTFADDGTYSVTATEIGSKTTVSSSGFTVLDGPTPDAFLRGSQTYSCEGDRLEILQHFVAEDYSADVAMVFARNG